MTLLEKMAGEVEERLKQHAYDRDAIDPREIVALVLKAAMSPSEALVHRMGARAFDGPQPAVGYTLYPAAMWRAGLSYVIEEGDRAPDDTEGEGDDAA